MMSDTTEQPPVEAPAPPQSVASEHRGEDRVVALRAVKLHGAHAVFDGVLIDVSVSGALIAIVDPKWQHVPEEDDMGMGGLRLASHFGEDLKIEFLGTETTLDAAVSRLSEGMVGGIAVTQLGCVFRREPTESEMKDVGLHAIIEPTIVEVPVPAPAPANIIVEGAEPGDGPTTVVLSAGDGSRRRRREKLPPTEVRLTNGGPPVTVEELLSLTVDRNATDLHIKAGSPIRMRVGGSLKPLGPNVLTPREAEGYVHDMLSDEQWERFEEDNDLDMAYSLPGRARFRVNVLRSRGDCGLAIRRIPEEVPSVEMLGLAPLCREVSSKPRGLILVTGPTGSGKSTTLAAMIRHINESRDCHIVTMEDPIEYIHSEIQAHITQREIGRDTTDFASALRRALRQDPDVILVGELRDLETISLAVTAAETGHLVLGTLHTTSATLTVDRVVDVFPPAQQRQIRMQLADALVAIFAQMLLPRRGGGVVVAQEVLVATAGVRALIREGKAPQMRNMMQTGAADGMQTMEDALNDLVARGLIPYETAVAKANHPKVIKPEGSILRPR